MSKEPKNLEPDGEAQGQADNGQEEDLEPGAGARVNSVTGTGSIKVTG
jgi:hypothetical protein